MKLFKSILISLALLMICSGGALAVNIQGVTGVPSNLPSTVSTYIPQGTINKSQLPLNQLIGSEDTVYYFETSNQYNANSTPENYGDDYGKLVGDNSNGYPYPLLVNSGTTWLILNNNVNVTGAIQVAKDANLNIIVCPTTTGVGLDVTIPSVGSTILEYQRFIGIINNGTINISGTTNNPNENYLGITFGNETYSSLNWNIREADDSATTTSFNVYSAYPELLYVVGNKDGTPQLPFLSNDKVNIGGGVLQVRNNSAEAPTAVLDNSTDLAVTGGVVMAGDLGQNALPLVKSGGTVTIDSSESSLIAASDFNDLTKLQPGIKDSLIIDLNTYNVTKPDNTVTGSTIANSNAIVVGNVTFGWGGQFEDFTFTQSGNPSLGSGESTLLIPTNGNLTIPSQCDISLGEDTVLTNNGTITVESTTPTTN